MKDLKRYVRKESIWMVGSILLYITAASLVSLHRYWQYNAFWYDFGIFDTTVWKLSRFQLPMMPQLAPPQGRLVWSDHLNPSVVLLAPLYWFTQKQEVILIAQSVWVGGSAFIAYLLTRKFIRQSVVRWALIVSYLGYVGMQNALYTDVHNIVFAVLPLMLMIWAMYERHWQWYWLFLVITLGFQESMAGVITMVGFFLLLKKEKESRMGVYTIIVGLLYGLIAMKGIIPAINNGRYSYTPAWPTHWYEWVSRFFYPLDMKLRSLLLTFATFGILPLSVFAVWPLIIEHYLERFVLNTAATRWDLGFHYNVLLSPIMFLACLEWCIRVQKSTIRQQWLSAWAVGTIIMVLFLHRVYLHGPLMLATHPVFYDETRQTSFLNPFIARIPRTGLLMTQNNLATHFTHQNTILLHSNYQEIQPDVIALDIRPGQNANDFFPLSPRGMEDLTASLSADTSYTKVKITDSEILFLRKK